MTPKKWWDNLDVASREQVCQATDISLIYSRWGWDELYEHLKRALADYHTTHLGTVTIEVTTWSVNRDRRPKKSYCSECGALMQGSKCWRCQK